MYWNFVVIDGIIRYQFENYAVKTYEKKMTDAKHVITYTENPVANIAKRK
jgi:hypothetical protein